MEKRGSRVTTKERITPARRAGIVARVNICDPDGSRIALFPSIGADLPTLLSTSPKTIG
jgi:hypothetical protein